MSLRIRSIVAAVSISFLLTFIAGFSPKAAGAEGFTEVRKVQDITEYKLDSNGLAVLLLPDHSAPAVTFMVTYRVGSRNESYGTTGATHLLEHLMFKGTYRHSKENGNGFDQLLERTGAITNATTWLDRTNYFETVPPTHLPLVIGLEADRLRNLRLREDDRRPEMTVVRNEFERGENLPSEALEKEVWATAYHAHPYHHSTIGWRSDIEKVPIEKLREFYDTFYWPDNATVTIIGDFDAAKTLDLIKRTYGTIGKAPRAIPQVYTEEPPQTGPRRVVVKRPGELGVVMLAHKIPPGTHADFPALEVLSLILSDGRNSRMYQALTDKSLTTDVSASPYFNRDPTLHLTTAELTPGTKHEDVEKKLLEEIAKVQDKGVTAEEVATAIAKNNAQTAFGRDGSFAIAAAINECIATGDWALYYTLDEAIARVTHEDVQRVAKKYFREDQCTTGWFIPHFPQNDDAAEKTSSVQRADTSGQWAVDSGQASGQWTGDSGQKGDDDADERPFESELCSLPTTHGSLPTAHSPLPMTACSLTAAQADEPAATPANESASKIAPRIQRDRIAGMDVLICPTGYRNVITIVGSFPAFEPENPTLAALAAEMLERGTKKHDANTIAAMLDQVGARISFSNDATSIRFSARCLKKDAPRVVSLLAEQLREPSFPEDEFEKLRIQSLAEAEQLRESTDAMAAHAFANAAFPEGHPHHRRMPEEIIASVKAAKLDDVKAFHAKWFGPAEVRMVVVGDVDAPQIRQELGKSFSEWKGGQTLPDVAAAKPPEKGNKIAVSIPGKRSVSVALGLPTGLRYPDEDHLRLSVATSVLGDGFTSRLIGKIRDTEGLTYGIGAVLSGGGTLDRTWSVRGTFAPSLLDRGLASTDRELRLWQRQGITAEELEYRKNALAGAHQVRLATSAGMANAILDAIERGLDPSWIDDYPAKLAALTLDEVNAAIKKYVDPDKLIIVTAGTFKEQ
ncbi:MAG: insulinase family protein [Planctomycetota bacterium]|nr:MAG: insulinase family protein [Planctomycetota bacterium]